MKRLYASAAASMVVFILTGLFLLYSNVRANVTFCGSGAGTSFKNVLPVAQTLCAQNVDALHGTYIVLALALLVMALTVPAALHRANQGA
jgi:hypothetical protein